MEHSQTVLVETEFVRVVREDIPVGGEIGRHTHEVPHLIVPMSGDRAQQVDGDGSVLFTVDFSELPPGHCIYVGPESLPLTHSLRNVGNSPMVHLRIDFLKA